VGYDADKNMARTPGANQTLVHQWIDNNNNQTFWVQALSTPAGAAGSMVTINDTAPSSDRWNLAAVEIVAR